MRLGFYTLREIKDTVLYCIWCQILLYCNQGQLALSPRHCYRRRTVSHSLTKGVVRMRKKLFRILVCAAFVLDMLITYAK